MPLHHRIWLRNRALRDGRWKGGANPS